MDVKKKIILLKIWVILSIVIIPGIIIVIYLSPNVFFNMSIIETSGVSIIGGDDGPTTIYISANYGIFDLVFALWLIMMDISIFGIKKIIEYKKGSKNNLKYYILVVLSLNILIVLLLTLRKMIE
jgi:hypothetical protein